MSEKETESLSLLENKRTSMNTESKIKKFLKVAIEKGWKEETHHVVFHPDKLIGLNLYKCVKILNSPKDIPDIDSDNIDPRISLSRAERFKLSRKKRKSKQRKSKQRKSKQRKYKKRKSKK